MYTQSSCTHHTASLTCQDCVQFRLETPYDKSYCVCDTILKCHFTELSTVLNRRAILVILHYLEAAGRGSPFCTRLNIMNLSPILEGLVNILYPL